MDMRTLLLAVTAFLICNAALPAQQSDACPGFADAAKAYIAANFASDEEKPANVQQKLIPLTPQVSALQIFVPPEADEKDARPRPYLAFFAGKSQCEFVQQWDGEIAEIIAAGGTQFVFAKTEDNEGDEHHANFQVITVTPAGDVSATRDQHGSEIYFSQTTQSRCSGKVGDVTRWVRDDQNGSIIILRQRHTDRDAKCRVIEDSSSYRYYRLKADHWHLDEGDMGE